MATKAVSAVTRSEQSRPWGVPERNPFGATAVIPSGLNRANEDLDLVAHDARNMVTALALYCDLLEEPGVLTAPFHHYGHELRQVAAASRRLVEKLAALNPDERRDAVPNPVPNAGLAFDSLKKPVQSVREAQRATASRWDLMPALPIDNLAAELIANRNLLTALAGPGIVLTVQTEGGARPVQLNGEDLTRILVNLVKNAAEAMPGGGKIQLLLRDLPVAAGASNAVALVIEDNGPGIPLRTLDKVFEAGFTTRTSSVSETGWPATHRGLGLSITRSIIENAGGSVHASNREPSGARLTLELPVRAG